MITRESPGPVILGSDSLPRLQDNDVPPVNNYACNSIPPVIPSPSSEPENQAQPDTPSTPKIPFKRHTPFSAPWIVARLRDSPDRALPLLRNWSHSKRCREMNDDTVREINDLSEELAIRAVKELKKPHVYVRGTSGSKLSIKSTVMTLDTQSEHTADMLVDSGSVGSCISTDFVREHGINTTPLARPIPVYNADGQPNSDGPIKEIVSLELRIKSHVERIDFAVTNLGKGQIFLGHDWLKLHNPSIDWREGTIALDRCPSFCLSEFTTACIDPDYDEEVPLFDNEDCPPFPPLDPEDHILVIDYNYFAIRASSSKSAELAAKGTENDPIRSFEQLVPPFLHDYHEVFTKEDFEKVPPSRPWDHAIELIPGAEPKLNCKVYPLSKDEQEQLDVFLEENLRTGRIRPSKSPMASPFFFIKKKDGKLRPIQDYRRLNDITIKNRYPLPLISELTDSLKNAKYFTKLDVRWGYNNVRIKKGDEHKAAFRTNRGLFEPLVMFFGLTNSPATFQTMMNDIFKDEIARGFVVIYLDDILIFSNDLEEHHRRTRLVLQKLRENKLYLKPDKCEFDKLETEYLGMIISQGTIAMDPVKVEGVVNWPTPASKTDVQSFLGFCNFYRRFIKGFAEIAHPLHPLTGNTPFTWETEHQKAFDKLKTVITTAPTLSIPTNDDPFRLETDASEYAVGAILSQKQDNTWKPIAFLSKALTPTQRNYEIYDRELLAIMLALGEFRKYLMNADKTFEIFTDHANLQYFKQPQKLNRRQARWLTELQEFHFTLHHISGKANSKADILSRRPGFDRGVNDNDDIVLLPDALFDPAIDLRAVGQDNSFDLPTVPFHTRIHRARRNIDRSVKLAIDSKKPGWQELKDGTLTFRDRVYVPMNKQLREDIMSEHHNTPLAGHPGRYKTAELVLRDYWWPTLQRDIGDYVDGCETCQRIKPHRTPHATPLHPLQPPTRPWEVITADIIGPLPPSKGCNAVLVIVDWFSKMVKYEAVHMEITASGFARVLRDRVFRNHGLPRKFVSDRDPRFVAKYIQELFTLLGIKRNPSTAYHPQTDGQTERVNQELEQYLRTFANFRQDDWKEWLPLAEFAHNDSPHSATHQTPFYLNYGHHPWKGQDTRGETRNVSAGRFADDMKKIWLDAEAALRQAAERMKNAYDKHVRPELNLNPGDKVYLESTNLKTDRPSKKLDNRRFGPFAVKRKVGAASYELIIPPNWPAIHPVFHESLLTPFRPPKFASQQRPPPPPPLEVQGDLEYEVEEILDSRKKYGKTQYLVHWKGYPREEDSWQPEANVKNAKDALKRFQERKKTRSQHVRAIVTHPNDPKLFDTDDGTFGIEFSPPPLPTFRDIILPLRHQEVVDLVKDRRLSLPPLPKHIKRVWIHETDNVKSTTFVIRLDDDHKPLRLYRLLKPISSKEYHGKYDAYPPRQLAKAPPWLLRDYAKHLLKFW